MFVYKEGVTVPRDVVRARIDPSVKCIQKDAFKGCQKLEWVEFTEGVEKIDDGAFDSCLSLVYIRTPSTTRVIGRLAFANCSSLLRAVLISGLAFSRARVRVASRLAIFVILIRCLDASAIAANPLSQ